MQMEINEVRHVNSVNSDITNKLLEPLDRKSKSDFYNLFDNIIFIQNLTNPDRQRAKHKPKDNKGKVIVDITNPHILEDMSYFVERAEHFRKHGVYTFLFPNKSPGSEYKKFWDEERRRCKEGLVRPSDGEWITGYNYFYWNYSPILKVEEADDEIMQKTLDDLEVGIRADRFEDFPDIWDGDYLFFHYVDQAESVGQHTSVIKTRGSGHSFKFSSMKNRNYFMYESSKSFSFASEKEFLTRDGVLSKAWVNMNFIDNNTPFSQPREFKDVDMHKRSSYKDPKHKTENGFMSEIIGVTCKNEPSKGRGKRGKLLAFDETGIFPGLKKTWTTARKSVEQGRFVYGHLSAGGTGGEEGSDFEALEAFTYHPRSYGIRPLKNVYDLSKADSESSMFVPAYLNRQGCYDENGNSDIIKALVEVLIQRQKIRQSSNDPNDLVREKAEAPITIQEAVLRVEGSLFPVQDLKDYLAEISPSIDRFTKGHFVGRFRISGSEVSFQMSEDMEPITEFPIKDNKNKEGAVEIFNHPIEFGGHIDSYRYIMGLDSFDDDHSTTTSLGSAIVFDRYTDRIVAEYTGRPNTANEFYELCYRLARYYNAKINYEAHPYSQLIKLPGGETKLWGEIKIGDELFAPNNKTTKVIAIPIDEKMPIYKMTLIDGREVYCSDNHIWSVHRLNEHPNEIRDYSTKEIMQIGTQNKFKQNNFFIPNGGRVDYKEKELPIPPYTMGLIIAEGSIRGSHCSKNQVQISSNKKDMEFYKTVVPYEIKYVGKMGVSWNLVINGCKEIFSTLGLIGSRSETKFIPDIYFYNSYENRLELLKGLMDGDGNAPKNGTPVYVTSSEKLANNVASLARSLGFNSSIRKRQTERLESYKVKIFTNETVFKLPRKVSNQYKCDGSLQGSKANACINKIAIKSIEFSHYEMGKCVTVDSDDGRYLIGDYIVTHNCDKKGLYAYFYNKNALNYLVDNPEILAEKDLAKITNNYGNKKKGTQSSTAVNAWARRLIADWLIEDAYGTGGTDEEGNEVPPLMNLQTLRSIGLIKELIAWHPDINADRVSAFGMVMILRADMMKLETSQDSKNRKNFFNEDPFFKRTGPNMKNESYNAVNFLS